jgi:NADH-quinone oxidoreductase subunit H
MISYEISLSLIILPIILVVNSFNLTEIVFFQQQAGWLVLPLFPLFLAFFVSMLAETNRTPFDLPEAEAELVAGYNVEYS